MPASTLSRRCRSHGVILSVLGLAALAALGTGCSNQASVRLELPQNYTAGVNVRGSNPAVTVRNIGPGEIIVRFVAAEAESAKGDDAQRLAIGSLSQHLPGGGTVQFSNRSPLASTVKVKIQRYDTVNIDPASPD